MKIALAQISPLSAEPGPPKLEKRHSSSPFPTLEHNLALVRKAVEQAADKADVIVFPEYFTQGIVNEGRQYLTFPASHILSTIRDLAQKHHIAIVGTIVHGALPSDAPSFPNPSPWTKDGQHAWAKFLEAYPATAEDNATPVLRNRAFFISAEGEELGSYTKRNLWHPEREYLTPGEEDHEVFDTPWGKAGLMICWDMSHPAHAQELATQGADLIFAPTYWLATDSEPLIHNHAHDKNYERDAVTALCMARAFETETVWVMCNAGGDEMEGYMGGSGVWAPLRGCVRRMEAAEGVEVVDVDLAVLKVSDAGAPLRQDARETYKIREDWAKNNSS